MILHGIILADAARPVDTAIAALPKWALPAGIAALVAIAALVLLMLRASKRRKAAPDRKSASTVAVRTPDVERETLPITAVGNVHGIGARQSQQDSFGVSSIANNRLVREKGILAIVADGMGGLENSGEISKAIVRSALKRFSEFSGSQRETLLMLGAEVNGLANEHFNASTGTTFIAASLRDNLLDFISIGDSRIALCRAGSLLMLNRVHNYAAELDSSAARGLVSVSSALHDPKRARLTSYVGMSEPRAVDMPVTPVELGKGDKLIIMTDGVFGTLTDAQIAGALALSAPEAALKIDELIKAANRADQDNYTAIIIEI